MSKKLIGHNDTLKENVNRIRNPEKYKCTKCYQGIMLIRKGKFGYFQGCNNYPECKHTIPFKNVIWKDIPVREK